MTEPQRRRLSNLLISLHGGDYSFSREIDPAIISSCNIFVTLLLLQLLEISCWNLGTL
jgi:hypothetical protein